MSYHQIGLVLLALAATTAVVAAEELNLATTSPDRPHIVRVRTGLDHGFTAEVGYDRVFTIPALSDRLLIAGVELAMPWAEPDFGDFQVRLGATMPILSRGPWTLSARLGPSLRSADSALARMTSLGADLGLTAGYYRRRYFVAAELGLEWAAATHIKNSDAYRSQVYPDAVDGWYGATGGTIRAGLHGGLSFSSFDVVVRAGRPLAIDLGSQTIPFYTTVGVNIPIGGGARRSGSRPANRGGLTARAE